MSGDNNSRRRAWSGEAVLATLTLLLIPVASVTADPRVDALASVLRDITGQLERFNNLYIDKLERELSTTSAKLASLEATVRSIADRAAAWDNIQNHMTVWTDQSRTMERKLDILNRCHEKQDSWEIRLNAVDALNHKLTALDKKINAMTRLEFKVEQVSERVEEVDSTVNWVKKQMDTPEHPIITEFAGRGLLSSLVTIENKLENITQSLADGGGSGGGSSSGSGGRVSTSGDYNTYKRPRQVHGSRYRQVRPTVEPEPGITFTTGYDESGTCYLHPRDSRRLQDVSAKVDLVFDRLTDPDYDYDYFVSHLHQRPSSLTVPSGDGHNGGVNRDNSEEEPSPEHLFARFWKSLFSPFKKMKRRFRVFENQLTAVQRSCNESGSLEAYVAEVGGVVQKKLVPLDQALREEMEVTRVAVNDQSANIEKVSQAVGNTAYVSEQLLTEMTNQFQALRTNIQDRFDETRNLILQYCAGGHNPREPDYTPREDPYTPRQDPNTPREDPYTPREEPYTPREEPYTPRETPSRPTYPTTATTRAPQYAPPTPPLPTSPRVENVRHRDNQVEPPQVEPEIHTLQGGRGHRFRTRYRYRFHDPPQNKMVKANRHSVKQAISRKSSQPRRGRKKGSRKTSRRRGRPRMGSERRQPEGLHVGRATRNVANQTSTASDLKGVTDCSDLLSQGVTHSTLFNFSPGSLYHLQQGHDFYTRYCDLETGGGGWTVIQRRGMYGPPYLNFTRDWQEYKEGFGDISREFWWGNDNIYRLLRDQDVMIRFDLWDFEDNYAYAEYLSFRIGAEMDNYRLNVFGYRGNASDSFSAHNGYLFSTYDRDNDEAPECCPCAPAYGGGWWFYSCFESNLNGDYHTDPKDNDYYRGIIWELWLGDYSLRATEMKIRPVSFSSDDTQGSPYPTPNPDPTQVVPNVPDVPELPLRHQ
ncbi:uncharacterized protein LOC121863773 isoform X2 [Homarus americanus]|uniref:uncharacterized protein LOC121863773 isoform X2 n=1 Tax=Homarus americanus TaxID=6706 RepID=UPI001C4532CB|nr:uncharacterized protein LOC121863773 isoform X2 [Homarus americanus]